MFLTPKLSKFYQGQQIPISCTVYITQCFSTGVPRRTSVPWASSKCAADLFIFLNYIRAQFEKDGSKFSSSAKKSLDVKHLKNAPMGTVRIKTFFPKTFLFQLSYYFLFLKLKKKSFFLQPFPLFISPLNIIKCLCHLILTAWLTF